MATSRRLSADVRTAEDRAAPSLLSGVRGLLDRMSPVRAHQTELIASLNEVADAVSSALGVEQVLQVIVERAKRVTDTDKAVLILADEHGEMLDVETIVVRGRRTMHPQEWWLQRLEEVADDVFATGRVLLEPHSEESAWLLCCPVRVKDRPVGLIAAINSAERPFSTVQIDFLAILSAFAASAIENARLNEQSRYVLLASERDRIAREMHDGIAQSLFSISLGLELCKKQVMREPAAVGVRLGELQDHLNTSLSELRRFIYDLRPMKLAELGLTGAIDYWIREVTLGKPLRGRLVVDGVAARLDPGQEACLYRIAKEAVSNVVKHARATEFTVHIDYHEDSVRMEITDDGRGFDVPETLDTGADRGIGLRSIMDRVEKEGGRFELRSSPESGTTLTVELLVGGSA